jgi:hypothetical protein
MPIDPKDYKSTTDSLADLLKRQSDLLQKASQADAGGKDRKDLIEQLAETTKAIDSLEARRREIIRSA